MKTMDAKEFADFKKKLETLADGHEKLLKDELDRITDRHLARCKRNTPAGVSPDSPALRLHWDRGGVQFLGGAAQAEVFNPKEYASFWEYGHRQHPGRVVFVELSPGQSLYGRPAQKVEHGKYAGKWGVVIVLKKPYAEGSHVMTDSETKAQRELDAAAARIENTIKRSLG